MVQRSCLPGNCRWRTDGEGSGGSGFNGGFCYGGFNQGNGWGCQRSTARSHWIIREKKVEN